MAAIILLSLGSGLLACSVVMAAWPMVRVLRLQNDLLSIRVQVREHAYSVGKLEKPEYKALDERLATVISTAPSLDVVCLFLAVFQEKDRIADLGNAKSFVEEAANAASIRIAIYALVESFSGTLLILICLAMTGWEKMRSSLPTTGAAFLDAASSQQAMAR